VPMKHGTLRLANANALLSNLGTLNVANTPAGKAANVSAMQRVRKVLAALLAKTSTPPSKSALASAATTAKSVQQEKSSIRLIAHVNALARSHTTSTVVRMVVGTAKAVTAFVMT